MITPCARVAGRYELAYEYTYLTPVGVLIGGGLEVALFADLNIKGKVCFISKKLIVGLHPLLVLNLGASIFGEIPKLLRAGFEIDFPVLTAGQITEVGRTPQLWMTETSHLALCILQPSLAPP